MPKPTRLTPALLAALGFIAAVGPFATDMYLASFTDIANTLNTGPAPVQLTLTAFLIGMSLGQLCNGPLSDRYGRRPVLLIALLIFTLASSAMVFSPNIGTFIGLRFIQGMSGSAGVVIARAIAVDLSTGGTAVRALSLLAMVSSLGPLLAPPVGGALASQLDWRGVLAVLALIALAMFLLSLLCIPESHPKAARPTGRWFEIFRGFTPLLRQPAYLAHTLSFAFAFAALMSYVSASPFVGQTLLGMNEFEYSLSFATGATALILTNLVNSRLAPRFNPRNMLTLGVCTLLIGSGGFVLLAATGWLSIWSLITCAFVTTAGAAFIMANASALALTLAGPQRRGAAAALLGATQFALGATASPLVGLWGEHTALPMAGCIAIAALIAALCTSIARKPRN